MRQLTTFLFLVLLSTSAITQSSGLITYKETMKMEFEIDLPEGIDLSAMLPETTSTYKELYFNGKQSVYIDAKGNESMDQEMESDDGSVQIMIKMEDNDEIYYTNLETALATHQTSFMGKEFLIEETIKKPKWKLTGEKVSYLGYECHKAELLLAADDFNKNQSIIVAWFAPGIPAQVGPRNYHSLPGAILMLSVDGDMFEYMATEVNLKADTTEKIIKPTKGKSVTQAEFKTIIKEKEEELKELGGGSFMFKN